MSRTHSSRHTAAQRRPLGKAHAFVSERSTAYQAWHRYPGHEKVHVGILIVDIIVAAILVSTLLLGDWPVNVGTIR